MGSPKVHLIKKIKTMAEVSSRGDHHPSQQQQKQRVRARRKKKSKTKQGAYTVDELIKLWSCKLDCPDEEKIVLRTHEVHEKGDQTKMRPIFPIEKEPDTTPSEIVAIKTRNFKKVHGRPRDFYTRDGFDYKV